MQFVRDFWSVLEPTAVFSEGWALYAIVQHLEAVSYGEIRRLLINVPPGFMKPIWIEELVLTKRGRVRLGDVVVDDEILTHRGRYRRVKKIAEQPDQPTIDVITHSGRRVRAEPSHPFLTTRGWVPAGDLKVGDILAAVSPVEVDRPNKLTLEAARLLGYIVGDGGVTHAPMFTNNDMDVIEDFERCAASLGMSTRRMQKKGCTAICLSIRGAREFLQEHGLLGKSSYTKRIPADVLGSSNKIIANFIGAYWSCDGMVKVRHHRARGDLHMSQCTTVGEGLAHDIQHALLRLGIDSRIRRKSRLMQSKKQPGGVYVSYDVHCLRHDDAVKFKDMPGLCTRKNEPLQQLTPQRFRQGPLLEDEIVRIADAGHVDCRCLAVDEDMSFTVNDIAVHNSLLTCVFWPAWEWSALNQPSTRYVTFSYSASLTERDNERFRNLVISEEFRAVYPNIVPDKLGVREVSNMATGWKRASSVTGATTGWRGNRIVLDDPHNAKQVESEDVRDATVRWFRESMSSRLNDLSTSAIVIIMQRLHEFDVSGVVLAEGFDYVHLMIPMQYEWSRHCVTEIGWQDPRGLDENGDPLVLVDDDGVRYPRDNAAAIELENEREGELAWPERFSPEFLPQLMAEIGPYAVAGQYQQAPTPRGGGIFKRDWWQPWDGDWPEFSFILASLDTAFTEKEQNDPSALTVWGVFQVDGMPKIMLIDSWRKRLEMHGSLPLQMFGEKDILGVPNQDYLRRCETVLKREARETDPAYYRRVQGEWGLVEWSAYTCRRRKVDRLIIENKTGGITAAQELARIHGHEGFGIDLVNITGDKVARALAVQPIFSQQMVYAPDREFAELVIQEMENFPRGRYRDLTDSSTLAVRWLRDNGFADRSEEVNRAEDDRKRLRKKVGPLYGVR